MNRNVFPENIFLFVLSGIYVLIFLHFYYNEKTCRNAVFQMIVTVFPVRLNSR